MIWAPTVLMFAWALAYSLTDNQLVMGCFAAATTAATVVAAVAILGDEGVHRGRH